MELISKDEILTQLFIMYDSVQTGYVLPKGLRNLIKTLATELNRYEECVQRDEGHEIKDF